MKDNFCELFVGHMKFVVSKATLLKDDRSYFARLISDYFNDRENDVIYIDRDGTHFNAILNHLRGCLELDNWTTRDLRELAIEADYYSLTNLEKQINSVIEKRQLIQYRPRIRFNCHLMNPDYDRLIARLKSNNRKTFVIFVRSDWEIEFEPFLARLEEECMMNSKEIELTFIYDIYPYQKIQMFHPGKRLLVNVVMLSSLDPLLTAEIAHSIDMAYRYT